MPLYFAKERPVVRRGGTLIMVDDDRLKLQPGEVDRAEDGALSHARLLSADRRASRARRRRCDEIIAEMRDSRSSERQGRLIDHDGSTSMEQKKQEGYF